jgi:3-deoxy-D-manno-octulosonic acid kinase
MIQAQVQSTPTGAILFDAALPEAPREAWFERAHWAALGLATDAGGGRGGVTFVRTPVGDCALRHCHRGGAVARLLGDRYVFLGRRRTRAFREFRLLARLLGAGLPVPTPVAARCVRHGIWYRADLLTRRIAGATTLAERLAGDAPGSAALAARVGRAIAGLHAANVWHADLNAGNVLVDADDRPWLIDFDRSRERAPARGWREANLARLRRSFDKLGPGRRPGFDERFWHPMRAAYHAALAQAAPASERGAPP